MITSRIGAGVAALLLGGCAHIDFTARNGLPYYVPKPYLFVSYDDTCTATATVISLPGEKRYMRFHGGYGKNNLSADFSNGMITKVGQQTDPQVGETITALAGLIPLLKKQGVKSGREGAATDASKSLRQKCLAPGLFSIDEKGGFGPDVLPAVIER